MLPVLPKSTSSHPEKKSEGEAARIQGASVQGEFDGLGKGDQNHKITDSVRLGGTTGGSSTPGCLHTPHTGRRGVRNARQDERQDESLKGDQKNREIAQKWP